jgi:hypothetical protein
VAAIAPATEPVPLSQCLPTLILFPDGGDNADIHSRVPPTGKNELKATQHCPSHRQHDGDAMVKPPLNLHLPSNYLLEACSGIGVDES